MSVTQIDIDDDALERAMALSRAKTKKEAVNGATAAVTAASRSRSSRQFLIRRVAPAAAPGTGHEGACLLP